MHMDKYSLRNEVFTYAIRTKESILACSRYFEPLYQYNLNVWIMRNRYNYKSGVMNIINTLNLVYWRTGVISTRI